MMAAMILPARFRQSRDSVDVQTARFWADWDGTVMEQRGRNPWQRFGSQRPGKRLDPARTVATGCHPLPFGSHGKQGVCRGLPPVAGGPLPAKEGVDLSCFGARYLLLLQSGDGLLQSGDGLLQSGHGH